MVQQVHNKLQLMEQHIQALGNALGQMQTASLVNDEKGQLQAVRQIDLLLKEVQKDAQALQEVNFLEGLIDAHIQQRVAQLLQEAVQNAKKQQLSSK